LREMGYVAMGFIALALVTAILTGRIAAAKA
jgi:hypothetical protein